MPIESARTYTYAGARVYTYTYTRVRHRHPPPPFLTLGRVPATAGGESRGSNPRQVKWISIEPARYRVSGGAETAEKYFRCFCFSSLPFSVLQIPRERRRWRSQTERPVQRIGRRMKREYSRSFARKLGRIVLLRMHDLSLWNNKVRKSG